MACSGTLETDISYLKNWYVQARYAFYNRLPYFKDAARTHWYANQDHLAIDDLITAVAWAGTGGDYLCGQFEPIYPEYCIIHIIEQHLAMLTVNMDAILTAMLGATFPQLERFIGLEDAYRVALWNAPFNADFYAALARGFMKW